MGLFNILKGKKSKPETLSETYERRIDEEHKRFKEENKDFYSMTLEEKQEYLRAQQEKKFEDALRKSQQHQEEIAAAKATVTDETTYSGDDGAITQSSDEFNAAMEALLAFNKQFGRGSGGVSTNQPANTKEITTAAELFEEPQTSGTLVKDEDATIDLAGKAPTTAAELLDGENAIDDFMKKMAELDKEYKKPGGFRL